jgi:hypothetical protein
MDALVSGLPRRNGWTIGEHAGDRAPDKTQRLLNRAAWDPFSAMSVVRRFAGCHRLGWYGLEENGDSLASWAPSGSGDHFISTCRLPAWRTFTGCGSLLSAADRNSGVGSSRTPV